MYSGRNILLSGKGLKWSGGFAFTLLLASFAFPQALKAEQGATIQVKSSGAAEGLSAQHWIIEGQKLYKAGLYTQAIGAFEKAFSIDPDNNTLFRIAISYQQLRDWDRCAGYMGRFLDSALPGPKRDRARNTKEICEERRQRGQILMVESVPPGASVYLGNRKKPQMQGQTPFSMTLAPGVQRVWIELPGYRPEIRDIQIQKNQPFTLKVVMRPDTRMGWLFVDSPIRDAEVYVDGQPLRLTPFDAPLQLASGSHQVIVRRTGYTGFKKRIEIEPYLMARIDAPMVPLRRRSTWRSNLGWALDVGGLVAIAGGVVAMDFANDEYNDTDRFDELSDLETTGYIVGSTLLVTGTALIIWDFFVDAIPMDDRNPEYGREVAIPDPLPLRSPQKETSAARPASTEASKSSTASPLKDSSP